MSDPSRTPTKKALPELLAPAGSPEAFRAAVAADPDAVYLSGKRFGARKFAANFSDEEIEEAVRFAHARAVRAYVTVNTLIHDREIAGTVEYIIWLYAIGVDAVLVQDIGIAALARQIIPDLTIHASTQMTIHNAEGVRWAAEQGFSRVVLARELSRVEVNRIASETADTGVGLEVFAHGALCYGYSGQCLLSSVIGGRSGNRGMCAQPCRKPYTLVTGKTDPYGRPEQLQELPARGQYLLSPKDLCTYQHLAALVASPVASLKIEGRMKSPEYVAIVTAAYRRTLDAIAAGDPATGPKEMDNLLLAFNRGFTAGYLFGDRHRVLMERDAPDNRGLYIGRVTRYEAKTRTASVKMESGRVPKPGDGLFFIDPERPEIQFGFSLNRVPVTAKGEIHISMPHPAGPGMKVYITSSVDLSAYARQIIGHPSPSLRHPVPLDLVVRVDDDGRLALSGRIRPGAGREIPVSCDPGITLVPAQSRPLTAELVEQQMRKSGGTPFVIESVKIQYGGNFFAPLADLNRARREFLALAESALIQASLPSEEQVRVAKSRWQTIADHYSTTIPYSPHIRRSVLPRLAVYTDYPDAVSRAAESGCDRVYFEPAVPVPETVSCCNRVSEAGPAGQILTAVELCRAHNILLVWKLPRITRSAFSDAVLPVVKQIAETGIAGIMVENPGMMHAIYALAPHTPLSGSTGLNVFNSATAQELSSRLDLITLSSELSRQECRALLAAARAQGPETTFALIVQGTSEAIITDDCLLEPRLHCRGNAEQQENVFFGIRDATGHVFPVRIDHECRTHIGNSAELCLVDRLPEILDMGINEVVIDGRGRTGAYVSEMTRIYREALDSISAQKAGWQKDLQGCKERVKRISRGEITAGHFIRGLKES